MTRPRQSALVLDGSEVKLRLTAGRQHTGSVVHIDWVRFTTARRNAPGVSFDKFAPLPTESVWDEDYRQAQIARVLSTLPDCDFDAPAQAHELAGEAARALGDAFEVNPEIRKGHDFYRFRFSIERNAVEVGWVGFLASGDSPRQQAQGRTLHCNIYGSACTFADVGWSERIADLVEARDADLTRVDLALDFFDGVPGKPDFMDRLEGDYRAGLMNVGGRKLMCDKQGKWPMDCERSFYFGSKEAGKQTNVYEKGDQLFGAEAKSPWIRCELRYGNKLRVLPVDMLRRPADFFSGASDWHSSMLAQAEPISHAKAEAVATIPRLALETVEAEAVRSLRWTLQIAGPSIATLFKHAGDKFIDLLDLDGRAGRLKKFTAVELDRAYAAAMERISSVGDVSPVLV